LEEIMGDRLKGKVVVVTGGASGIGLATVERFVEESAAVVVADVSGNETGAAQRLGGHTAACHCDVRKIDDIKLLFAYTEERFGRLDVLVNNAGVDGEFIPIHESSDENIMRVLEINTRAVLLGVKYGAQMMIKSGGGSIINTSSTAALRAVLNLSTYAASKAALIGFTRTAAVELGPLGIRINTVCPGTVDTPMLRAMLDENGMELMRGAVPLGRRLGKPSELASAILFLACDESSFVTGAVIPVDGGQSS
jgi:NAD(P)-dependent dehydrogenase (short-subunit alcohol dehydrogenase family)